MEISSQFVGARSAPHDYVITPRATMNFAAGVGDANPRYFEDDRPEGIIAPPLFAQTLTWPTCAEGLEPGAWGRDDFPYQVVRQQVHMFETLLWHKPMRPGMQATVVGQVAAITPHRAGTMMSLRLDGHDETGAPLFTEYATSLLRRVRCTDDGRGAENLPDTPDAGADGEPRWVSEIALHPLAAHMYDGCADIHFPLHTSRKFAKEVGLARPIMQGAATLAYAFRELVNREAGGEAERFRRLGCRFSAMVEPGTTIQVCLVSAREDGDCRQLFFEVLNHKGRRALSSGYAELDK